MYIKIIKHSNTGRLWVGSLVQLVVTGSYWWIVGKPDPS